MSKISQQLENTRQERSQEQLDLLKEEDMREQFDKDDQRKKQETQAFKQGKSRRNLYDELSREGIEPGRYKVNLVKVAPAKTAAGVEIVRFTYRLTEPYEYENDMLNNVHVNNTSSNEWNEERQTNYALQNLGTLYGVLDAEESFADDASTKEIVEALQQQLDDGLKEKEFEVNINVNKTTNDGRTMVFYQVYPL